MIGQLAGRSLLHLLDFTPQEIEGLLDLAARVKKERIDGRRPQRFQGMTLAMIFEKRSTRTRCAFETAFGEEGGHPVFLSTSDIQLGGKETVEDTARVLGRMFDGIQFRGFSQRTVEILAEYSGKPVFNGLTDDFHPTQALADIMTLREAFGTTAGRTLTYIGDGRNNVAASLIIICAKLGIECRIISPGELQPPADLLDTVRSFAAAGTHVSSDPADAAGSDAVYTDVWVSMGEESQQQQRTALLQPYQVNASLMQLAGPDCIFLHCLPAVVGQEVTKEVFEGSTSRIWDQAENRKHTIKAVMLATMADPE
ncbi:ornithine carbamoyltransferase [Spirochaeta africana]|uniref:Ornithine carbamoyltransferase n=1 Tax=Spirochaeta africana (strain ATCC 700263 / DSM 8902 / Z-7692) TaxID=889378 RepID=H9UI78_SPIAZ|nr:ornithine carbamoyltransferase [Spirochaeta africana]AFG37221.1 ornithine carbamoyltransferase [Spirochaeta africana DSM 8902]